MVRGLVRGLLIVIVVVAVVAFFIGYRWGDADGGSQPEPAAVGTTGGSVDVDSARETGAEIGRRVAEGANQAQRLAASAALTAKIKSKMALDDTIEATDIDVDTVDGVVTLNGSVGSPAERARAVQLARETEGVARLIDLLTIH